MVPVSAESPSSLSINPQTLVGVLIVAAGILMLGDNLGLLEARHVLGWWPVGVLAVGGLMFTRAADGAGRTWAAFVTLVGAWWTLSVLMGWPVRLSTIFPVGLVMIGVVVIQRALGLQRVEPGSTDQTVSDLAFWAGVERKVTSSLFRRADLTAIMGGIQLDFRQAAINGEAVIDLFVLMGGVEIKVPPDWVVSNQAIAVMGGAVDKSTGSADSKHRLVLRGFVMMGGVEVKT
jgi:predicted membrane protein